MSEQVPLTIKLCNRTYRIKAAAENEATIRKTVQTITEKINDFKTQFPGRDDHDYMAMILLDYITSAKNPLPVSNVKTDELMTKLNDISNLLDE
ncbi:MAG: cell division protein ZapA [Bacteroidetes bacterium]|nr:cell division protein ZapA [Bacteroidota bacterium]